MTPRGGPLLLMVSPPHRRRLMTSGRHFPQHEAGRATDNGSPFFPTAGRGNLTYWNIGTETAPSVVCLAGSSPEEVEATLPHLQGLVAQIGSFFWVFGFIISDLFRVRSRPVFSILKFSKF